MPNPEPLNLKVVLCTVLGHEERVVHKLAHDHIAEDMSACEFLGTQGLVVRGTLKAFGASVRGLGSNPEETPKR